MITLEKKILMLTTVLIFLLTISCVSAIDGNNTDTTLQTNQESADDTFQASPNESNLQSINSDPDVLFDSSNASSYLILDNDADIENIHIGEMVTWIVSVVNLGPDTAKNVKVYDKLPDGLEYIKHSTTKGTFNPENGIWHIGNLSIDDGKVYLYITTKAITLGEKVNKAYLTTDTVNLNLNKSYEEEELDVIEEDDDDDDYDKSSLLYPAGNPVALLLFSVFGIMIPFKKRR